MLKNARGGVQLPTPFEGPAVGLPIRTAQAVQEVLPTASQAFNGLVETLPEVAPEIGAVLPEVAEVAGAGLGLGPIGLTVGLTGLAGSGLYFLGKHLLEKNPNDRVAQSLVKHEIYKHHRAKRLSVHMFDNNWSQAGIV